MPKLLIIFIGSGTGGLLRYAVSGWAQRLANGTFPFGTLVVNLTGCLLIGFLTATLSGRVLVREEYRVALLIGLLGGYTTFSTFGMETFALLNDGQTWRALLNVAASIVLGLAGVWANAVDLSWRSFGVGLAENPARVDRRLR